MQTIYIYATAASPLGVVRDSANAKNSTVPTLMRGVETCLKLRLFQATEGAAPYPLAELQSIQTWDCRIDSDFDPATTPKLVADNTQISVSEVTEGTGEDAVSYSEISIPISNMNTQELAAWLATDKSKSGLTLELTGYDSSAADIFVLQIEGFTVRNRIGSLGEATEIPPDVYNKSQVDALLNAGFTVQFVTAAGDVPTETETATAHTTQSATDTHYRYRNASTPNGDWTTWIRMIPGAHGKPGGQGSDGTDGTNGATFTPSVDSAGDLSWTNDGGLTNPTTVNIKGPQGNAGTNGANGITPHIDATTKHWFIGTTDTGINAEGNIASVLTIGANGNWYIDGTDTGVQAQGQTGSAGADGSNGTDGTNGATFTPAVDSAGNLSWTNDGGLTNPDTVNIKGVQGDAGADGQFTNGVAPVSFTSADLTNSVLTKTFTQLGVAGTNPLVLQIVDNSGVIQDASSGVSVTWSTTGVSIDLSGITGGVSGTWKLIFGGGSDASVLGDINTILDNINGEVL